MSRYLSIKLKALFLLIVFASNTLVGFACAMGFDMGFNTTQQAKAEELLEMHVHEKETSAAANHNHQNGDIRQHDNKPAKQVPTRVSVSFTKSSDECCSDDVQKFQNLDKNLNQNVNTRIDFSAFVAIVSTFLGIDLSQDSKDFPPKNKAKFFYPPPLDIRIAIQSFQI